MVASDNSPLIWPVYDMQNGVLRPNLNWLFGDLLVIHTSPFTKLLVNLDLCPMTPFLRLNLKETLKKLILA